MVSKKKLTQWGIFLGLLLVFALALMIWAHFYMQRDHQNKADLSQSSIVTVARVAVTTIRQEIEALGTAKADEAVTLSANVTEYIQRLYFDDGQWVNKGDLLVQFEDAEERAQLQQAIARYQEAKKQYQRTLQLSNKKYLSASEHDTSEANLKSTEATIKTIEAQIKDRQIIAPFSGVLGLRQVSEGALIEPGDTIVNLDKIDKIKIDFTLPEKYLSSISLGQEVAIIADAFPTHVFKGKITSIVTRVDPQSRAFTMRVVLANPDSKLRPGMLLHVAIQGPPQQVILIPEQAVVPRDNKQYVFVIDDSHQVRMQEVKLGERFPGKVIILSGLQPNMTIVVEGGFKLEPGQSVIMKDAE